MQLLVSVFVLSRLDYCNAVLAGLPSSSLAPLQHVLYAAVRLVTGVGSRDHITETMMELHWLPIGYRVKFKLCLIIHAAVSGQCPDYIREVVMPLAMLPERNRLRAAVNGLYVVPRTRTMFGQRAFSVAGPQQWNDLPSDNRDITDCAAFKRALKSHFFRLAYVVVIDRFYLDFTDIFILYVTVIVVVRRFRTIGWCRKRHINWLLLTYLLIEDK